MKEINCDLFLLCLLCVRSVIRVNNKNKSNRAPSGGSIVPKRNTEIRITAKDNQKDRDITALYVRVSTDAQFEEGYSVDAQKEKLIKWCEIKDYQNYRIYQDGGWSGSNLDRPEMKKLISDITNHKVKTTMFCK